MISPLATATTARIATLIRWIKTVSTDKTTLSPIMVVGARLTASCVFTARRSITKILATAALSALKTTASTVKW